MANQTIYVQCVAFNQYCDIIKWKQTKGHSWHSGNPVVFNMTEASAEYNKYGSDTCISIEDGRGMNRKAYAEKKGTVITFNDFYHTYISGPFSVASNQSQYGKLKVNEGAYIKGTFTTSPVSTINSNNNNLTTKTTMKEQIKNVMGLVKLSNEQVAMTFNGKLAVQRKDGQYVRYDEANDAISIQSILPTFKIGKFCFCIPTPSSSLKKGDIIFHKGDFKEVISVEGGLKAINLNSGAVNGIKKEVIEGLAGFSMLPKLVSLFNGGNLSGSESMNPMMMALMMKEGKDMNDMLPLLLMGQNGQQNALLPMLLASGEDIDPMMLMLMQNQQGGQMDMNSMLPLMMMSGNGGDMKDLLLMSALSGGNLFGQATPKAEVVSDSKDEEIARLKAELEAKAVLDAKDAEIEALKAQLAAKNNAESK